MPYRALLAAGAAAAAALVPATASASAAHGRYTTIDVPGAAATFAVGVNDLGVVGGFYVDNSGNDHGFTDQRGAITTVDVPGAAGTVLTCVNDLG
jgi:opacity protein-like surface antigen